MTIVAYVVVTWNNRDIVGECLEAIQSQVRHVGPVYVLDNNSSDGTPEYIAHAFPAARLTIANENSGFARGCNLLIAKALAETDAEYIALVNSDAVLSPLWTLNIIEHIRRDQWTAGAQGLTLDYFDHGLVDSQHLYVAPNLQAVQFGFRRPVVESYMQPTRVFGVCASAALYTRAFVESQPDEKLFDERFYMYLEDVDVAFRAFMTGWSSYSVPAAVAYHRGSASSERRSSNFATEMCFRNQSAVIVKNAPVPLVLRQSVRFLGGELAQYRALRRSGGWQSLSGAVRGRMQGLARIGRYVGSRRAISGRRTTGTGMLRRVMYRQGIVGPTA